VDEAHISKPQATSAKRLAVVADDDATTRAILADYLGEKGFEIVEAASGREAVTLIEKEMASLDLIVLDLLMPDMDGFDVLIEVRFATRERGIPIVVVTGSNWEEGSCARDLGADEVLLKGFTGDELFALIDPLLAKQPRA